MATEHLIDKAGFAYVGITYSDKLILLIQEHTNHILVLEGWLKFASREKVSEAVTNTLQVDSIRILI